MTQYNQTIRVGWIVDYIRDDNIEESITIAAHGIIEAIAIANEKLIKISDENGWTRWMIWNISIMPDECFN